MDYEKILTKNDAIFFMDMVGWNPNFIFKSYKKKPYTKLLSQKNSDNYERFIEVYKAMRHVLPEREQIILNEIYGVKKERSTLKKVAELLDISPEHVRQLRNRAEDKIVKEILEKLKHDNN
ncbi:sigma factor-like helix-turn-helix DNA-binding protein [Peribacillus frigoritolerans]|uniref:sigma factor-like helix-turn-helix DNA-binding protein n=1 Tax=Peribacillus frigoritolerans TaxID=450367 RepID=UPI002280D2F4|nr:sigma factor-like helix-turn-helix DNA-binding protein [Peribacillus frigoritolerans]MCY8938857.1 hypothetical protein [Peribacillus frigoritolerans]